MWEIYIDCYWDYNWRNTTIIKNDHALVHTVANNQIKSRVQKQNITVTISTIKLHLQKWTLLCCKKKVTQPNIYAIITIEKQVLLTLTLARCRSTPYISRRFAWSKKLNSASAGVCPLQKWSNYTKPSNIYYNLHILKDPQNKTHNSKILILVTQNCFRMGRIHYQYIYNFISSRK
jgi:hypothetical protein